MTGRWMCSCGGPWEGPGRHKVEMARLNYSQWRGSPSLIVPYRQWIREKLPNGNEGFVCCGDDGFIRSFNAADMADVGEVAAVEWKTYGKEIDEPTRKAFGAVSCGHIRGVLAVRLHDGNVPGPLSHYPVARQFVGGGDGDWLPEQPEVASRITVTDYRKLFDHQVSELGLIDAIKSAAGYAVRRSEVA